MSLESVLMPALEPFDAGHLPVGDGHRLYYEQCGRPDGLPVVYLHGGPGNGCRPHNRRYYDPSVWRIVLFDQRGCGRSEPYATVEANTTGHLIADIDRLRRHLGIDRWAVAGGSWGSLLALLYAQAHPQDCLGLLLRGVFLGRRIEEDWWWRDGTRWLFPDRWEALRDFLPETERDDLLAGYHRRLCDPDPAVHLPAAVALRTYSGWTVSFRPDADYVESVAEPRQALTIARLFTHYCVNRFFIDDGAALAGLDRIRHLPGLIVQGRYDAVTPARSAWELHRAWSGSELDIVNDGNHSVDEPDMAAAMIRAQARLAGRLSPAVAHQEGDHVQG